MARGVRRNILPFMMLVLLSGTGGVLAAQEATWGGTIDSSGSLEITDDFGDPTWEISASTALWGRTLFPVGEDAEIAVTGQVSYTWSDDRLYLVDVDAFRLAGRYPGLFGASSVVRATAGRFLMSDISSFIVNERIDGLEVELAFPAARIGLSAAYTGLLLNPVSSIVMTEADLADTGDGDEFFGARRLIGKAELSFPEFFARQTATVSAIGQWDLRDAEQDEETIDSGYFGIAFDGPIGPGLFYELTSSLSPWTTRLNNGTEQGLGLLLSTRLRYFRPDWLSSQFGLSGVMASGAGPVLDQFVTITRADVGIILDLPVRNIAFGEVSYSVVPFQTARNRVLRDLQVGVSSRTFFRVSTDEVPDTSGIDPLSDGRLIGTEAMLDLGWRLLSDLGMSLGGGVFIPATGSFGVFGDDSPMVFTARFQLSSSF